MTEDAPASAPHGSPGAPVPFIVGCQRSGTTLLRLMLDAHPRLAIPPETHFIPKLADACARSAAPGRTFLEGLVAHRTWPDYHLEAEALRSAISAIEPFDLSAALRCFYGQYARRFSKPRWGDKTPDYHARMPLIQSLLPEARFIHLVRDGRDVALSLTSVWFGPRTLADAAFEWCGVLERVDRDRPRLHHYLEVSYEQLVAHPEATLRRVCRFLELDWDPAMLNYHRDARDRLGELERGGHSRSDGRAVTPAERRAVHERTRRAPLRSRVERWRAEMSPEARHQVERIAGDWLERLGYEVAVDPATVDRRGEWFARLERARLELDGLFAPGQRFILADGGTWPAWASAPRYRAVPFVERDGVYAGPPGDGHAAVRELRRLHQQQLRWFVLAWPAFAWLDAFPEFAAFLRERCRLVAETDQIIVYDLGGGGPRPTETPGA